MVVVVVVFVDVEVVSPIGNIVVVNDIVVDDVGFVVLEATVEYDDGCCGSW